MNFFYEENQYIKYADWLTLVKKQCNDENCIGQRLFYKNEDYYKHYKLDNGLHVYLLDGKRKSDVWIFEEEIQQGSPTGEGEQRFFHIEEFDGEFNNLAVQFNVGFVSQGDKVPGYIIYQDDMGYEVSFLPDIPGSEAAIEPHIYFVESPDASKDIETHLKSAIQDTRNPEIKSSYQKALDFYTKIYDSIRTRQDKGKDNKTSDVGLENR